MKIRKILCLPIEIDTEKRLILVKEGEKNTQYNIHESVVSDDFVPFLSVVVYALLYDEKIAKMEPVPQVKPTEEKPKE